MRCFSQKEKEGKPVHTMSLYPCKTSYLNIHHEHMLSKKKKKKKKKKKHAIIV